MTKFIIRVIVFSGCSTAALLAQGGGAGSAASPTGVQLPLSGRAGQSGSATVNQTPVPGTTASVNTLNTSISVSGPYSGSVPSTAKMPFTGKLSLKEAIQRSLDYNLASIGLSQSVRQARAQSTIARSGLLPNINGSFRENVLKSDLAALGVRVPFVPSVVGPFSYFDLRATLTQSVADLTLWNNYKASKELITANEQAMQDVRDTIVLAAGGAYLQVIAAKARLESANAQLDTAKALFDQTRQNREAGLVSEIELSKSLVNRQTREQRLVTLQNDLAKQKINLARIAGLPPNDKFEVSENVVFSPLPDLTVDQSVRQALDTRSDLKSAETQVRAAELAKKASKAERYPSIGFSYDYGVIGPTFSQGERTFTFAGQVRIPIWQGGRNAGDVEMASAAVDQRKAEVDDVRSKIEADVRNAFLDLEAAASQVQIAMNNQGATRQTLHLTREKFEAGVTDSVEVTQAEEAVASADLDYITSLFAHNVAKLSLARAMGRAEQRVDTFLQVR